MKFPSLRRKAKRDEEMEALRRQLADSENARIGWQHTVRQMDQIIYQMSQCENWNQMRPLFQGLLDGTNLRMKNESDRIRGLMVREIYGTNMALPPVQVPNIEYRKGAK